MTRGLRFVSLAGGALLLSASALFAQTNQQAQLRVTVVDQTGAGIPTAVVRVTRDGGAVVEFQTDDRGVATTTGLAVGAVQLHVEFEGFVPYDRVLTLRRGNNNQTVTLGIAGLQEEIVVTDTTATQDARGNSMSTVLEAEDVEELSDDPDELQAQLEAMTGGAGAVFQVNGFRGGRLPNRSEIQQIRFRTNSFAAENHDAGRVQVEIITRPGLTQWSGNANLGLRTDVLNARNAFAQTQTPEQFRRFTMGLRGPVVRNRTSLRFNVDGNRSFDSGTIVALTPSGSVADQVRRPFEQTNVTFGIEHGLTRNNTLRFEFRNGEDERRNLGVGDFSLLERAYTRSSSEQQVRTSVQSVIGRNLNEFRVQWNTRESVSESATATPSVIVIDAFSSGGAGVSSRGTTTTLEVADNFDFTVGKQAMRVGMLFEAGNYRNFDARNAAGTFTFGSLDAYLDGRPNTFTQRLGQVDTDFNQYQLGFYWQDDFRLSRALSVSVGLRNEMQNHIGDKVNLMPRLGFTWNPFGSRTTTVRGGYGTFFDWYDSNLHDQTLRVDGVSQVDVLVLNPGYPDPTAGAAATVLAGGRVQAARDLRMPYVHQASIGVERAITPALNAQASFMLIRGRNQMRSVNVNAPDAFGVRPEPGIGTITQIASTGRSESDRLNLNLNYRVPGRRIFMNANYTFAHLRNYADNALSLPADSLNPDAEWGPGAQDIRHRFNTMVNFPLWFGLRANIGANGSSGAPYTITTGSDDNQDGVSNDRPAGVGRNTARGSARFELSTRLTKSFGFGGPRDGQGAGAGAGAPGGGRGGAGAGPGAGALPPPPPGGGQQIIQGGPGGGGPGGGGGGFFGGDGTNQRYSVELYVQAFNLLNRVNFVNYSGNLQSPFFGQPTSSAQARRVEVGMQFRF
jgi:hypothetical protein